jgi:hypothetical protein
LKYKNKNIEKLKEEIIKNEFIIKCRRNEKDFTRNRKVMPKDIILYELNKKGLSTKMEIINFNNINDIQNISSPGLFKQREKLNPDSFIYLTQISLKSFYYDYSNEVKTYNGYILKAVDGSDFEIPNTKAAREKYNGKQQNQCARVTVSTCYDILNKYTLDTIVEKYDFSETEMLNRHLNTINNEKLLGEFKSITIADRNYKNLSFFYQSIKKDEKFLIRIASSCYEKETQAMKSDDEIIEIGYEYNRVKYYKDTDKELYEYLKSGKSIKIRCVKIALETGEIEYLLTNLDNNEFSTDEINKLYNLRWKIELNYKHLKNNLKIECITSSKDLLIKQDIYSQVLVANMLQAFINDSDEELQKLKYKNKVKTNNNMAIGIFKNTLIYILLEDDAKKRLEMMEKFQEAIMKYIISTKPNRKSIRKNNPKNRYHINQRKTF